MAPPRIWPPVRHVDRSCSFPDAAIITKNISRRFTNGTVPDGV